MSGARAPELDYQPDPAAWLVGPTPERPRDVWLPGAVEAVCDDFEAESEEARAFITRVLEVFSLDDDSPLTERLLRWRGIMDEPFPVRLGMVARQDWPEESLDQYLNSLDLPIVEAASIDVIDGGRATRIRRGLSYSHGDGSLVVSVRYVIESQSRSLVAMLHAATDIPAQMIEAVADLDDLARCVDVLGELE